MANGSAAGAHTLYEAVGGVPFFEELVDRFYDGVARDPQLLALYPEPADLGAARRHLRLFLAQYWGGPTEYSELRGHPALRMRHAPFAIGADARDRWLVHMRSALASMHPAPDVARAFEDYLTMAADALRNTDA
jgi:hemoglobin